MSGLDYSTNYNNINQVNRFLAENSNKLINQNRTFNQWTGKETDSCEYNNRLNLATKPMEYYVNNINSIAGLPNDETFLSFTPIGNAATVNIPNINERPIPSTLQTTSSVYNLPYNTSPFLGSSNNINVLDTDIDLTLKTGLHLRSKNNQAELSEKKWPRYGDIHAAAIEATVQNAGQLVDPKIPKTLNPNIPGLDVTQNNITKGIGIMGMSPGLNYFIDTYTMNANYQNGPFKTNKK